MLEMMISIDSLHSSDNRVMIVDACRTPIGKTGGNLSCFNETELMSIVLKEMYNRYKLDECLIDDVLIGCCFSMEPRNMAKKALIMAGLPASIPAMTINRTCASSMEAIIIGAQKIRQGESDVIISGGTENMNQNPHVMKMNIQNIRHNLKYGMPLCPEDMTEEELSDNIGKSIELMARRYSISKELQDDYAIKSHTKANRAWEKGFFNNETISIISRGNVLVERDEGIIPVINEQDILSASPLYFRDGTITKYNASSISDGASALILMSMKTALENNITPMAEVVSSALIGTSFGNMGIAAAEALHKVLKRSGIKLEDIDLIECNEAYSAQMLICERETGWDSSKVNINGGSLALGHPLGCTGARICTTLIHNMVRLKRRYGVATMCAGGGMGEAILFRLYEDKH